MLLHAKGEIVAILKLKGHVISTALRDFVAVRVHAYCAARRAILLNGEIMDLGPGRSRHEATGFHHASRRRGSVTALGSRTAAGEEDAADWFVDDDRRERT
jgi:hypothetical protein